MQFPKGKSVQAKTDPHVDAMPAVRTSEGLRDTLFDTLDGIRSGKTSAQEAQAICKVCQQIINSVNTEVEFYKHIGRHEQNGKMPRTVLALGSGGAKVAQPHMEPTT